MPKHKKESRKPKTDIVIHSWPWSGQQKPLVNLQSAQVVNIRSAATIKGSECKEIHAITHCDTVNEQLERIRKTPVRLVDVTRKLDQMYQDLVGQGGKLIFHFLNVDESARIGFHDRYFLSERGAINFGKGFTFEHPEIPRIANVIGEEAHQSLRDNYINPSKMANDLASIVRGASSHTICGLS